jgi:hypothetical protein
MNQKVHTWPQPEHWADRVVYVPLRELALCSESLGQLQRQSSGTTELVTVDTLMRQWCVPGREVDAYVLPQPDGTAVAGFRYGADGPDYTSVYCNQARLQALLEKSTHELSPAQR